MNDLYRIKPLEWRSHELYNGELMYKGYSAVFGDGEQYQYQSWAYCGDEGGYIAHAMPKGNVVAILPTLEEVQAACEEHHRKRLLPGLQPNPSPADSASV